MCKLLAGLLRESIIIIPNLCDKMGSVRNIPKDFVRSVLYNGVGRYVCQLQRITLLFCKHTSTSKGLR